MTNLIFAILITTSAGAFDVDTTTGPLDQNFDLIQSQPWFGDKDLAVEIAGALDVGVFVVDWLTFDGGTRYLFDAAFNTLNVGVVIGGMRPQPRDCDGAGGGVGVIGCGSITFATVSPAVATVPIGGLAILLTLMVWIMEAGRWSRPS